MQSKVYPAPLVKAKNIKQNMFESTVLNRIYACSYTICFDTNTTYLDPNLKHELVSIQICVYFCVGNLVELLIRLYHQLKYTLIVSIISFNYYFICNGEFHTISMYEM